MNKSTKNNRQQTVIISMMSHHMRESDESVSFDFSLWENGYDQHYKLEVAMKYLINLSLMHDNHEAKQTEEASLYIETSHKIMQHLHQQFQQGDEAYLPWVRFLDISAPKKDRYVGKKVGDAGYIFRQGIEDLVINILTQNQTVLTMDWRIAKRILSLPILFPEKTGLLPLIAKEAIRRAFQTEVDKALQQMVWARSTSLACLAKRTLQILSECLNDKASDDPLSQALIVGRFDKKKFGLKNSLILGEDGGLYLLLNRLSKEQQKEMKDENIVTEVYLNDKIKNRPGDKDKIDDRVVLGQGGFGKVKFALSLFGGKAGAGDVVCIKKTKNFLELTSNQKDLTISALQSVTEATLGDYFMSGIADKVYAPRIFDLAIVAPRDSQDVSLVHKKGYLMMEVFPQNTAAKIFKESQYQLWNYQKPFLREIMVATLGLLNDRIAFTDLKPDNALFDPDTFKTTIIDLGGTIKIAADDSLDNFDKSKYSFQFTEGYCPPEMNDYSQVIDMPKALAFTCGKVMEEVVENSDYPRLELKELIDKLTDPKPDQRISIDEALQSLKEMGDDATNENILLSQYITKIKGRIANNMSSIGLNEDILNPKKLYIDLKITARDPAKYKKQRVGDLLQQMDLFLAEDQDQKQVMLIFGSAGSGKSIALQLRFIEAVQKWEEGEPLPLYFNLANGVDLKTIINSMNSELGTNLKIQELKNDVHLYIDNFDQGLDIEKNRETLIKDYIAELKDSHPKILVTCRSSYLDSDSNQSWFYPQSNAFNKLGICYVAPISYVQNENSEESTLQIHRGMQERFAVLEHEGFIDADNLLKISKGYQSLLKVTNWEERENENNGSDNEENKFDRSFLEFVVRHYESMWKRHAAVYLKCYNERMKQKDLEMTLEKIESLNIEELMDTGLMFHMIMEVLPDLLGGETRVGGISKQEICRKYVTKYQKEKLEKLTEEQKSQVIEYTKFISRSQGKKDSLIETMRDLGKYLAVQLHLQSKFRLEQDASIFQALGYESQIQFKKQVPWQILKLLPLKIETKHGNISNQTRIQEVKLGFIHDTIKNCYLIEAIQDEMSTKNGKSQILASKSITADSELVSFIAEAAYHDDVFKKYLRKAIDFTKTDKSPGSTIYAANCMTILVSARHSFLCQDLSNISIKGSNLKNGIFSGVDFTGADLSSTILQNFQAGGAIFKNTNLIGAQLGILPDLQGHENDVWNVQFSRDGKYLASSSGDKTIKIWEVQTGKCLNTFLGHTDKVLSVSFSGNGNYLASGSHDKTVKIWKVNSQECVATLEDHTDKVSSVSFSSDGRYVASASSDRTVKVWEVQTNNCFATFQGHSDRVTSVSFSGEGQLLASGSTDCTLKIWELQTNKCLGTLRGHTKEVWSVSFSDDGKYVASGSWDQTVRVWEVQTRECCFTLKDHSHRVWVVSFSRDGKYIASGSEDHTVKIWSMQTDECLATLQGHNGKILGVSFSDDGKYLASSSEDKVVKIWNLSESRSNLIAQGQAGEVFAMSLSGDGRSLALGSTKGTIKIWELQTNKSLVTLRGYNQRINSLSFSGDGRYIASGASDFAVRIWDVQTGKCVSTLLGHSHRVWSVKFSRDGKYIASKSDDKTVKIWEVQTKKCLISLEGRVGHSECVSFSGDGKYVASCLSDKTVQIWEIQTDRCLVTLRGHTDLIWCVSFSVHGKYFATGSFDNTIKLWEVPKFKCLDTLVGHTGHVNAVSFTDDGKYLASGSEDYTVRIWETQQGKCLMTLQAHVSRLMTVMFSGDGGSLVSNSEDGTVKIWSNCGAKWLIAGHFCDTEPKLSMDGAVLEGAAVSNQNVQVFEQRGALVKQNKIVTNPAIEMEHQPAIGQETAEKLSTQLLSIQMKAYEELQRQKIVQVQISSLPRQIEQKKPKEALAQNETIDQQQTIVQKRQNDESLRRVSATEVNLDDNKAITSHKKLQAQIKAEETKRSEPIKRKSTACCSLF